MARIPVYENQVKAGGPVGGFTDASAFGGKAFEQAGSADARRAASEQTTGTALGAAAESEFAQGSELQRVGGQMERAGSSLSDIAASRRKYLETQNTAAEVASFNYTPRMLERQTQAGPDAKGFTTDTSSDYDARVEEHVSKSKIDDPWLRTQLRSQLMNQKQGVISTAAGFETKTAAENSKRLADDAISTLQNKVRTDPNSFEQSRVDGVQLLDTRAEIPAVVREKMKLDFTANLARARFDNMVSSAGTVDDVDKVTSDLVNPANKWQEYMSPADYARTVDGLKTARTTVQTKADSVAREAIAGLRERNNSATLIDPEELAGVVRLTKESRNTTRQWEIAEIQRDQDIYRRNAGLPAEELLRKRAQVQGMGSATEGVVGGGMGAARTPIPVIANAINSAAAATGISAGYLAGMHGREANHAKEKAGVFDYGNDAGASGAVGPAQFIPETWLNVVRGNGGLNARLMGLDPNASDDALLKARGDPDKAMMGAALLAKGNQKAMSDALQRPVAENELYMAHFLGANGAVKLLNAAKADPNAPASVLLPKAAAANPDMFTVKTGGDGGAGMPISTGQLVARLTGGYSAQPSRIAYADAGAYDKLIAAQDKAKRDGTMLDYAASTGRFAVNSIPKPGEPSDPSTMAARGAQARAISDFYNIPKADMLPLTKTEAESYTKIVKEGTTDQVLTVMGQLQGLGPEMARVAYKQVGQDDAVFEHAAKLYQEQGSMTVARDIVQGQKRLSEASEMKNAIGAQDRDVSSAFNETVGNSLVGLGGRAEKQVAEAALAHYVSTHLSTGAGKYGQFDKAAYQRSVSAVMGGNIGTVNAKPTVLPAGIDAATFDKSLDNMSTADYVRFSDSGAPPRYGDGQLIDPSEIAREGRFQAVGGNKYEITMADNRPAIAVADPKTGQAIKYRFVADAAAMRQIAARPRPGLPAGSVQRDAGLSDPAFGEAGAIPQSTGAYD